MASPSKSKIEEKIKEKFGFNPKEFQLTTLQCLKRGQDVFLSTKTGGGKSVCYQGFPLIWRESHVNEPCSVLVVTPLLSIMKEQCDFLEEQGFAATYIGRSTEGDKAIEAGKLDFVFSSPENLLSVDR